ncbi:M13 family peptidase [Alteromonadaceae bacterium M269]|nr:M13 family peptidase [Alteromonadaceae bacterium M269]
MKRLLLSIAISTALFACGNSEVNESTQSQPATPAAAPESAKAELGSFGIELDVRDLNVAPGDDFFRYAGGKWLSEFEIPSDRTTFGAFTILRQRTEERVKAIFDDLLASNPAQGTLEGKIANYFTSYMNADKVNELGISPLRPLLVNIANIETRKDLIDALGRSGTDRTSSPIGVFIGVDRKDPNRYMVNMGHGGLGLPDKSYYLQDSERFQKIRAAYELHIAQMLGFAGIENTEEKAKRIMALETKIAEQHWSRADRRNRDKTYNPYTVSSLKKEFPELDWDTFLAGTGLPEFKDLNVGQPSAFAALIDLMNTVPVEDWRAYLNYHAISNHAGLLSDEISDANFEFYGKTLRGQPEQRERWTRAVQQVAGRGNTLGEAVGKIYVDRHFKADAKRQMDDLVENLRVALGQRIDNLSWMSDTTKREAHEKLSTFDPKIGYPDEWKDVSSIELKADDLFGNVKRVREFYTNRSIARLNQPTNKIEWGRNTPQTVNATYNPAFNQITFPAGILQPPFFDPAADPAVNYGAIGAVIGHEMGHGFDDQGSKSDAYGIQRNWWTDEDRAKFEQKATALAEQYNGYEPVPGNFVDGRFTLGENIGDLGGLSMAYHAYKLSLNGKEAPVLDGLTGDQRFFLAWAQVWRAKAREAATLARLKSDPHSPAEYRVNGVVRNIDEWYEAFNVQPDHELYLPPEERVRIW